MSIFKFRCIHTNLFTLQLQRILKECMGSCVWMFCDPTTRIGLWCWIIGRVCVSVRPTSGPVWSVCVLRSLITWHSFTPRAALALSCIQITQTANLTSHVQHRMKREGGERKKKTSRRTTSEEHAALPADTDLRVVLEKKTRDGGY